MFERKKKTRVFRWIWRANSILILFVGIGAICFLIFATITVIREQMRFRQHNSVQVQTQSNETIKVKFDYGKFARIEGTDFAMSPITSEQKTYSSVFESSSSSYKSGYSTAVRNFAFFNFKDKETKFLFENNGKLIVSNSKITKQKSHDDSETVVAYLSFQVVAEDTNKDGQLNLKDKLTIAFSNIDGTNYLELLNDVDQIIGEERVSDDLMLYTFVSNDKTVISLINLPESKIVSIKELPSVN